MLVGAGQIAALDAPLAPLAAPSSEGESIALLAVPSPAHRCFAAGMFGERRGRQRVHCPKGRNVCIARRVAMLPLLMESR